MSHAEPLKRKKEKPNQTHTPTHNHQNKAQSKTPRTLTVREESFLPKMAGEHEVLEATAGVLESWYPTKRQARDPGRKENLQVAEAFCFQIPHQQPCSSLFLFLSFTPTIAHCNDLDPCETI